MPSTYNPIRAEESKPRRAMFQHRDAPEPGVALVVHREGRPLILLRTTRDRLTAGEAWWGSIKTVYSVDTADHEIEFSCELPCEGHAFHFGATLKLTCQVKDPVLVVERGITDAREALEKLLVDAMRDVSRHYRVEDAAKAELAIRDALVKREDAAGFSEAFRLDDIVVALTLEEAAADHVRRLKEEERAQERSLRALIRQKDLEISRAEVERERDRLKGERDALRAKLDEGRIRDQAAMERTRVRLKGELDQQQATLDAERKRQEVGLEGELERLRDELETERAQRRGERDRLLGELERVQVDREGEIERRRAELEIERLGLYKQLYAPLIEQGDWSMLAVQLLRSSDPEAVTKVVKMVREQRDTDVDRQLSALKLLLEQDALEGAQLAQVAAEGRELLRRLITSWAPGQLPAAEQGYGERPAASETVVTRSQDGERDGEEDVAKRGSGEQPVG